MPPVRKYPKEEIIDVAYKIVAEEGIKSLNARKIASILGCSVQPIFHNFSSMEELEKKVYEKIYNKYQEYMNSGLEKENPYKQMGLSYIRFAHDYPEFFKILFMQQTDLNAENFIMSDNVGNNVIKIGQNLTNLSYEEQKKFHVKVWIFTHGIACLVATKTVDLKEEEISKLLQDSVREMLKGYLSERKEENEKHNWSKKFN